MRTAGCSGVVCFMVALHSCTIRTPTRFTGGASGDDADAAAPLGGGRACCCGGDDPAAASAAAAAAAGPAAAAVAGILTPAAAAPLPSALGSCGYHEHMLQLRVVGSSYAWTQVVSSLQFLGTAARMARQ